MTGICTTCMKGARVPSHRGTRLADMRSTCCSAPMMGPTTRRCPRCRAAVVLVWDVGATSSRCCMVIPAEGVQSGGRFNSEQHQMHVCPPGKPTAQDKE